MSPSSPASIGPLALFALLVAGCGAVAPVAPRHALGAASAAAQPAPEAPAPAATDAPPVVTIVSPVPSPFLARYFQFDQPATIRWAATDPDGPGPGVRDFRYLLISDQDNGGLDYYLARVDPDSIVHRDAPEFTNWTRVDGSVDHVTFIGLYPTSN